MVLELRVVVRAHAVVVDRHDLARLHIADILGTHRVKGAGFARNDIPLTQLTDGQRMQAVLVAAGIDTARGHHQERKGTLHHIQRIQDGLDTGTVATIILLDKVSQDFAVGVGLEQTTLLLEVALQLRCIDQLTVVGNGKVARIVVKVERLNILGAVALGSRIEDVTDGHATLHRLQFVAFEDLRYEALALDTVEMGVVIHTHNTTSLLTAVLQGMKPVVGQRGGVIDPIDAEYATLIVDISILIHTLLFDATLQTC